VVDCQGERDRTLITGRWTGALLAEASSPLPAAQLDYYFAMTIRRAIAKSNASVHGVPIAAVDFVPRCHDVSDPPKMINPHYDRPTTTG
jgi:hypothetical protein